MTGIRPYAVIRGHNPYDWSRCSRDGQSENFIPKFE